MKKLVLTAITAIVVTFAAGSPAAAAEFMGLDEFPRVGKDQQVTLSGVERPELLSLWVVYSPNSETQEETKIGRLSESGEIAWKPTRFGIATLSARDETGSTVASSNLAIVYSTTPLSGVFVMLFAGALLFGGAIVSLTFVLRSGAVVE